MAYKKPDLAAKLANQRPRAETEAAPVALTPTPAPPKRAAKSELPWMNTRQPADAITNLKTVAARTNHTMEWLVLDALNSLFAQHGLPEISQPPSRRK